MDKFFDIEEINPNLNLLNENYDIILDEFLKNKEELVFINWDSNRYVLNHNETNPYKGWRVAALYCRYQQWMEFQEKDAEKIYEQKVYFDKAKGISYTENAKKLPILCDLCYKAGIRERVGISVLFPENNIEWHIDDDPEPDRMHIIRGLWGLDINKKPNQICDLKMKTRNGIITKEFYNKNFMFFWGRILHMILNTLDTPRYCLCFDNLKIMK
jgi:hypothetical protein